MFETSKSCCCMVFFGYFLIYFSCYTDRKMVIMTSHFDSLLDKKQTLVEYLQSRGKIDLPVNA